MESFNNWLIREQSSKKTVLSVFDFDGTIANVPEKPSSDDKKHHWDGKDWWGSSASLEPPFYDGWVNDEVVSAFKKAKSDPETHAILLTGRRGVNSHAVRTVLRNQGLHGRRIIPDSNQKEKNKYKDLIDQKKDIPHKMNHDSHDEYFSGDHRTEPKYPIDPNSKKGKPAGDTMSHKTYVVKNLMHDGIREVHFWDDRDDHVANWVKLAKELKEKYSNLKIVLHKVNPPASRNQKAKIDHINI